MSVTVCRDLSQRPSRNHSPRHRFWVSTFYGSAGAIQCVCIGHAPGLQNAPKKTTHAITHAHTSHLRLQGSRPEGRAPWHVRACQIESTPVSQTSAVREGPQETLPKPCFHAHQKERRRPKWMQRIRWPCLQQAPLLSLPSWPLCPRGGGAHRIERQNARGDLAGLRLTHVTRSVWWSWRWVQCPPLQLANQLWENPTFELGSPRERG